MQNLKSLVLVMLASVAVTGCATVDRKVGYYKGNSPDLAPQDVGKYAADQKVILATLQDLAGTGALSNGGDWDPVVDAGMSYVNVRCSRFMDALFWLNRVRETSSNQIRYAGAGTSALLALVQASKQLIGIAPLGFGFLDQTVNNVGQGLLYNLDPGVVRDLVARQQATYRDAVRQTHYTTGPATLHVVQDYAALCLPASIEAEVNRAIANSEFEAVNHRVPLQVEQSPTPPSKPTVPAAATTEAPANNAVPTVEQKRPEQ